MGNKVIGNFSWKFAERICAQIVTLIVSIILARILTPNDYGIIAIVTIFITLANVFVSDGFGNALIQKKDCDALDYSSVLYFNFALSIILYIILFFTAPLIALFYGEGFEILVPVIRVLGTRIIIASVNSVQQAYIAKKMMFKKFFFGTLIGSLSSGVIGIYMVFNGFGIWSIVGQYLSNTVIGTLALAVIIRKKPLLAFSWQRIKLMAGFGVKILGAGILITGYQELRAIIIGKVYSSSDLAYYDKGKQFPSLIGTNINTSIGAVLFPKMAEEQDDISRIKTITRNSIRFSSYLMCPLMLGLAAVAHNFVLVVLTAKWLPCVILMQLFCIIYLFNPIHTANMQAIKAIGRSDIYLKLEVVKKVLELIALLIFMWISVEAIVISLAVLTTLFTFINAYPNKKLINYSFKEQMLDLLPALLMSITMAVGVFLIGLLPLNSVLVLVIQVIFGAVFYLILSIITKNKEFKYLTNIIRRK